VVLRASMRDSSQYSTLCTSINDIYRSSARLFVTTAYYTLLIGFSSFSRCHCDETHIRATNVEEHSVCGASAGVIRKYVPMAEPAYLVGRKNDIHS